VRASTLTGSFNGLPADFACVGKGYAIADLELDRPSEV
jgi:hypothetical protein